MLLIQYYTMFRSTPKPAPTKLGGSQTSTGKIRSTSKEVSTELGGS